MKEDQRIKTKTAILATNKGYKASNNDLFYMFNNVVEMKTNFVGGVGGNEKTYYKSTQTALQKWLRDKHGLSVEVSYYHGYSEDRYYYEIKMKSDEQFLGNQDSDDNKYTYEQALELGLREALKYIK